jgi:hypothetical protein
MMRAVLILVATAIAVAGVLTGRSVLFWAGFGLFWLALWFTRKRHDPVKVDS